MACSPRPHHKAVSTLALSFQDPEFGALRDQGMQIDLWASKKTPGQMINKINELNSIYRMKIDTSLPPVRYEEVPYTPEPVQPVEEAPKPKPQATQPATTSASSTKKNNDNTSSTKSVNKDKTETKPKVKKVVVE